MKILENILKFVMNFVFKFNQMINLFFKNKI